MSSVRKKWSFPPFSVQAQRGRVDFAWPGKKSARQRAVVGCGVAVKQEMLTFSWVLIAMVSWIAFINTQNSHCFLE
jgi:hypothetical protein